ncbi:class I SAM-dependent methyltransferase [Sphingomonas sp. RHCKR7]|uniref:class I SAM-dependent methyltransferase n=1 Tax=Sphingomonas folli TaxID=2862497 RepID=UPI001C66CCBB|nr:class I SAM-dependent methyltransferase [Sphingomonas folli]MBW6527735.1 class I SAM-dependent methyltransferase [Sphingomonas folli]
MSDVSYPTFFYKEMQPLWLATVAGFLGIVAPDVARDFTLCELGCGAGVNLLIAAACHPTSRFVGVDFNKEHLDTARQAAAAAGIGNVEFVHADFASFGAVCGEQFDFVTCHGVWSWIAAEDQQHLIDIAARCLIPGGLFYLHYMCHPGSTQLAPLQHLLNLCAHHMPGPSTRQAQTGMRLLAQVAAGGAFTEEPAMHRHLANMARRQPADLAHEFLTDHWEPAHSANVHQQVAGSGLTYIGSADVFNNLDPSLSVPGGLQGLIRRTAVPALAETLKDMARNAHQRTDLFQKGARSVSGSIVAASLSSTRFTALPAAPRRGPVTFTTPIGSVEGPASSYTPVLERLATGPASGAELARLPALDGDIGELLQVVQLLMMQQLAHPMLANAPVTDERSLRLGSWLAEHDVPLQLVPACATAIA